MSIADKLLQIAENEQKVYNAGYEKGKAEGGSSEPVLQEATFTENGEYLPDEGYDGFGKVTVDVANEGGGDNGELVAAYGSSIFTCMMYMTNLPDSYGSNSLSMADEEGNEIAGFYGDVRPGDKYRIVLTRIDGYDYWQTFVFSVGDYMTLIEPATNENVLKHTTVIDDNTYEITIPEGCYWFNVNFYNRIPCYIYKLN